MLCGLSVPAGKWNCTVAVYSEADKDALHAQLADEAVCIGTWLLPLESYRNTADFKRSHCRKGRSHSPRLWLSSENSRFAKMCEECHIAFIGPSAEVIEKMGNKAEARKTMVQAGIPVVPGTEEPVYEAEEALLRAEEIGFPVMIKARSAAEERVCGCLMTEGFSGEFPHSPDRNHTCLCR